MSRYLGPKHKLCRRLGTKVCDSLKCPVVRRPYKPGQHGPKGHTHLSEYGKQLLEKQKARFIYGVTERQFRRYYARAKAKRGNTGLMLLSLLERRLDNTIFRSGLAQTRKAARQLISHGHVLVNKRLTHVASCEVYPSDVLELTPRSENMELIQAAKRGMDKHVCPSWIQIPSRNPVQVHISGEPAENDLQQGIDPALIVEFYSR